MRLLLDTHIAIWAAKNPDQLSRLASNLLADQRNDLFISDVSIWEIAIKHSLPGRSGRIPFDARAAVQFFDKAGFETLSIEQSHVVAVQDLPRIHGDPFDRLLIAQARCEGLTLVTADGLLAQYGEAVLVV